MKYWDLSVIQTILKPVIMSVLIQFHFPRIKDAISLNIDKKYETSDDDFKKLVAILSLAVPYTGLILTAREAPDVRREVMQYGVSQIDGGTKLELGSYSDSKNEEQNLNREQFKINDAQITCRSN